MIRPRNDRLKVSSPHLQLQLPKLVRRVGACHGDRSLRDLRPEAPPTGQFDFLVDPKGELLIVEEGRALCLERRVLSGLDRHRGVWASTGVEPLRLGSLHRIRAAANVGFLSAANRNASASVNCDGTMRSCAHAGTLNATMHVAYTKHFRIHTSWRAKRLSSGGLRPHAATQALAQELGRMEKESRKQG